MSCYLTLSRRHELVVARAAGVSAWQFVALAVVAAFVLGAVATTLYNPVSARSKHLEADMQGATLSALHQSNSGFWVREKSSDGAAIINAISSREQGAQLGGVSVYTFDNSAAISKIAPRRKAPPCRKATGCLKTHAFTWPAKRRSGTDLPAADQPHARAGARELRDA